METKGNQKITTGSNGMRNQRTMIPSAAVNYLPQNIDEGLNLVPIQNKAALLHACMVCPDLVQRESPPLRFLEFENYNYFAAAVRWAKYWDARLKSLGPERAFLPIADFTGNGAIPANLIDYMAAGAVVLLPPDDQQRPVLFVDRSRLPLECLHWSNECRQKLGFAILQKIMLLSKDFVVIFYASSKPRFFPGMGEWFTDMLKYAFPMKVSAIYLACKSPKSRFKSFVATYIPVMMKILNKNFRDVAVDIFVGDKDELLKKLILKGLNPADLPESVGGTWKYEVFEEWVRRQKVTTSTALLQESALSNGLKMLSVTIDKPKGSTSSVMQKKGNDSPLHLKEEYDIAESVRKKPAQSALEIKAVRSELDAMDIEEKLDYVEVLKEAPHLEATEANVDLFLFLEDGNAKKAAERIVKYWRMRRALFKNLSLRPLQQNNGGALNEDDLRTMKCGYIALLPNNNEGNSVICCDASRLANDDEASRLRCLFYILRVASQKTPENASVSVLLIMNKLSYERSKGNVAFAEILKVYPVKVVSIHVIRQPARLGIKFFEDKVVPSIESIFGSLSIPIHIHSGTPTCDLRQDLASHGFDFKNLPRSLGGGWTYEDFLRWRDDQLSFEDSTRFQTKSSISNGHLLSSSSTLSSKPSAISDIHDQSMSSVIPLSLDTVGHSIPYPLQFLSAQPNQSLAGRQDSNYFHQKLDQQLLHLNQHSFPSHWQLAHPINQHLDQQQIQILHQRLENQNFLSSSTVIQRRHIGDNVIRDQKTDAKYMVPVTPLLADVLDSRDRTMEYPMNAQF